VGVVLAQWRGVLLHPVRQRREPVDDAGQRIHRWRPDLVGADPLDANYAYAIWNRSRFPSDKRYQHSVSGFPRSLRSDAYFSRTTNGGATWEAPHAIFAPSANQLGIGHQIEVVRAGPHAGR
jgi:hypothetical protein